MQVDKHVQSEAVSTQLKLEALLAAKSAATLLHTPDKGTDGGGGGEGGALMTEDGEQLTTVQVTDGWMDAHTHTCTHAHMHTCTHAHMHTCVHACMRAYVHVPAGAAPLP